MRETDDQRRERHASKERARLARCREDPECAERMRARSRSTPTARKRRAKQKEDLDRVAAMVANGTLRVRQATAADLARLDTARARRIEHPAPTQSERV